MRRALRWWAAVSLLGLAACDTGEGTGSATSDALFVEDCWDGPFALEPTFFAANPVQREGQIFFRIQRGDDIQEFSDGMTILVKNVPEIRASRLGEPLRVGLPRGVAPPGVPLTFDPDPPLVHMALYLHETCNVAITTVYSLDGTITFDALFSGDPNESDADDKLTEATFEATFADPRDLQPDGSVDPDKQSVIEGSFRFFFQRGQPAQPFP